MLLERIAIVCEDDEDLLSGLVGNLKNDKALAGIRIIACLTAEEALEALKSAGVASVAVCVMDGSPGKVRYGAIDDFLALGYPPERMVVYSAETDLKKQADARKLPHFLRKPGTLQQLSALIRKALVGSSAPAEHYRRPQGTSAPRTSPPPSNGLRN